jgi:hypothetical protein
MPNGKTETLYVLSATPEAKIALGLKRRLSRLRYGTKLRDAPQAPVRLDDAGPVHLRVWRLKLWAADEKRVRVTKSIVSEPHRLLSRIGELRRLRQDGLKQLLPCGQDHSPLGNPSRCLGFKKSLAPLPHQNWRQVKPMVSEKYASATTIMTTTSSPAAICSSIPIRFSIEPLSGAASREL